MDTDRSIPIRYYVILNKNLFWFPMLFLSYLYSSSIFVFFDYFLKKLWLFLLAYFFQCLKLMQFYFYLLSILFSHPPRFLYNVVFFRILLVLSSFEHFREVAKSDRFFIVT